MICSSGIGFDPLVDGRRLHLGFHGIWQGVAVLYDRETQSLWFHLTGRAYAGPLEGTALARLPTGRHTTWQDWRTDHPGTRVLAVDERFVGRVGDRGYFGREGCRRGDPFLPDVFRRTLKDTDDRLPLHELVHGAVVAGQPVAWPIRSVLDAGLVSTRVGEVPVLLWGDRASGSVVAFERRLGEEVLEFVPAGDRRVRDEGGSLFDREGVAREGPRAGQRLRPLDGLQAEWYGWFAHHPDTRLER